MCQDVIDFTFLLDCLAAGRLLPLRNTYFLSRSSREEAGTGDGDGDGGRKRKRACDLFGLGFDEELDLDGAELERLLGGMGAVLEAARKTSQGRLKAAAAAPSKAKGRARAPAKSPGTTEEDDEEERCLLEDAQRLADLTWRDILTQHIQPAANTTSTTSSIAAAAAAVVSSSDDGQLSDPQDPDPDRDPDLVLPSVNRLWCGGRLVFFLEGVGEAGLRGQVLRQRMLLQGAVISERLDDAVTHVVLCGRPIRPDLSRGHQYQLVAASAMEQLLLLLLGEGGADPNVHVEAALQAITVASR